MPSVPTVLTVSISASHTFSKYPQDYIRLIAGFGVEGDAHLGDTVKHRSRVKRDPTQSNLRQVHLIHAELHDELNKNGFSISPGAMGENITTRGIDMLGLSTGTQLHIGESAIIEVTGLRNPCYQLDDFQKGLMSAVLGENKNGELIRKAGIMGIVLADGVIYPGDSIKVKLPAQPHIPLAPV